MTDLNAPQGREREAVYSVCMPLQDSIREETFERKAHLAVADLHHPRPSIFWTDLILTGFFGWWAFAIAAFSRQAVMIVVAAALSVVLLYRGLCFVHEVTHIRPKSLPGFETAWNLIFGVPLLLPSYMYVGVHEDHHRLATYGTPQDPEYLPFADSRPLTIRFLLQSLMLPLLLVIRGLVMTPVTLVSQEFRRWVAVHASALVMNPAYEKPIQRSTIGKMVRWEIVLLSVWSAAGFLLVRGFLPWRALAIWLVTVSFIALINTLRALVAHRYEAYGQPRDRIAQLEDSIDTPGFWWTELWAPVGLRYHALHHFFPGIPYHNLGIAYRRLIGLFPCNSAYSKVTSPGMWKTFLDLCATARNRETERVEYD
jgi:fatty acid desaturase